MVGAGPSDTQPARSWGAHASPLVKTIRSQPRCGGALSAEDFERIVTWIDLNAPYYPSYACANPGNLSGRSPLDPKQLARLEELTGVPLHTFAAHGRKAGPQVCFDRPELSPCLAGLASGDKSRYQEALALIVAGKAAQEKMPEADMPGFAVCEMDGWRQQKYLARQQQEQRSREAIGAGSKVFDPESR